MRFDQELEDVIKELLHNSHRIDARDITVTVDNANVTLSGTVHTQADRDYAVSIVKLVQGVGEVEVDLIVKRNEGILPTDVGRHP
jgi:osmotically-inducible protein OsmY